MASLLEEPMNVIDILRISYLAAAAFVLLVFVIPPLRMRFLSYGARAIPSSADAKAHDKDEQRTTGSWLESLLDGIANTTVPHAWFTSFYAVSVAASLFWLSQIFTNGPAFRSIERTLPADSPSMTFRQTMVAWTLMLAQGSRRLYECLNASQPSASRMWIGHWILGIWYYAATSVAIWVEGSPSLRSHTVKVTDFAIGGMDLRSFTSILLFILASGIQNDCHSYLASLKSSKGTSEKQATDIKTPPTNYKLPAHPAFSSLIAPHYTAECVIYLALAIFAAPQGCWMNWTLVSALLFVVVNLGVTAHGTKQWYEKTFGADAIKGRWRMIPWVF